MKKLLAVSLSLLTVLSLAVMGKNSTSTTAGAQAGATTNGKRGPIFRATKDQIKQVQAILKEKGFYSGEQTGKLDVDTRAGLKKYQAAESLKVTGTLNRVTLVKIGIELTEKQKAM